MTITEFLRARLAEDQAAAQETTRDLWRVEASHKGTGWEYLVVADHEMGPPAFGLVKRNDAEHIVRHQPARVFAEIKAKLRIIGAAEAAAELGRETADHWYTLRLLAAVYADHPDYRQEWAP